MTYPSRYSSLFCDGKDIGDRWSLVILRDIIAGKRRYQDFIASSEGIPTNILADRLKSLERTGLLLKRPTRIIRFATNIC